MQELEVKTFLSIFGIFKHLEARYGLAIFIPIFGYEPGKEKNDGVFLDRIVEFNASLNYLVGTHAYHQRDMKVDSLLGKYNHI
jgi:hypothetical protein